MVATVALTVVLGACGVSQATSPTGRTESTGEPGTSAHGAASSKGSHAGVSGSATGSPTPEATTNDSGATSTAPTSFDPKVIDPVAENVTPALPVTVTDASGTKVTVTNADRIIAVSLSGTLAEIVFTLGLGHRVVGRDIASTFHAAADLPVITSGHDLAAEPVLKLDPTLLLIDASVGPPEVIEQIRAAGVTVVTIPEAWSLDDVAPRITAVADALGVPEQGKQLVARTRQQIDQALASAPTGPPLRIAFLYVRGSAGVYLLAGKGSGADSMIEAIGAEDAGTAIGISKFRPLTSEGLILAAPDVILVMTDGLASVGGVDGLLKLPGVAQTPAGQHRRIVAMDDSALLSFGPRTGEMVQALAAAVYGS